MACHSGTELFRPEFLQIMDHFKRERQWNSVWLLFPKERSPRVIRAKEFFAHFCPYRSLWICGYDFSLNPRTLESWNPSIIAQSFEDESNFSIDFNLKS